MSELMCSQSKCRRKDEHIAELKTENAELREALETIRDSGLEPIDPAYRRLATDALQEKGE